MKKQMQMIIILLTLIVAVTACQTSNAKNGNVQEKEAAKQKDSVSNQNAEKALSPEEEAARKKAEQEAEAAAQKAAAEQKEKELAELATNLIAEADFAARGYYYDEAMIKLKNSEVAQRPEVVAKIAEIQAQKDALVKYEGDSYHVFFHSLIVDPKVAFSSSTSNGYNFWMTTVGEFKGMLPILLEKGFVIYRLEEMLDFDENGNAKPKDIYLPAGKKPLILSVDDVNYYYYMQRDGGFPLRLDINDQGETVTVMKQADGSEVQTYDGDVFPIVEQFVKEHPEFSYRGAKGIVAVTGYEGVFGYRINELQKFRTAADAKLPVHTPEEEAAIEAGAIKVAQGLRANGWELASHSFTHGQYFRKGTITVDQLKYEISEINKKVIPYTGEMKIFISPFGMHLKGNDPRFKYLTEEAGYPIFCPVGKHMTTFYTGKGMSQERLNLDGLTMLHQPKNAWKFFTLEEIDSFIEKSRPALIW